MPKYDPTAELAERMLQTLAQQRIAPDGHYPLTLKQLAALADPHAAGPEVEKASSKKTFLNQAVVAQAKNLDAPVALKDDVEKLAGSALLLEFVLEQLCTPAAPAWPVNKLRTKVVTTLKKPLEEAVKQQIAEQTLPPTVGAVQVKKAHHLYLKRMPPPPPPKPPAEELAEKLLRVLEAQSRLGKDAYPLALKRLVELTAPQATAKLVKQAVSKEPFHQDAVIAVKNHPEAPVALGRDRKTLAACPPLLELTLKVCRTGKIHGFSVTNLQKKVVPELRQSFQEAVKRQLESGGLPSSVGWILKGDKLLFLMDDLNGGQRPKSHLAPQPAAKPLAPAEEDRAAEQQQGAAHNFAEAFDAAFQQLDRQRGGHNFVSLVDLRKAVAVERNTFDAGLSGLRRAGRYSLIDAEGRHGITAEEREAGIEEDGALFVYVSRKSS